MSNNKNSAYFVLLRNILDKAIVNANLKFIWIVLVYTKCAARKFYVRGLVVYILRNLAIEKWFRNYWKT